MSQEAVRPTTVGEMADEGKLLLTVEEAAQRLGIGRTAMYQLVSTGAVESVTLGRLRRVPRECLAAYVAALRAADRGDGQGRERHTEVR